jgi:hypothetical protein
MPLPLALVFHFNQHTSEYADIANRACYRGLLNVLRAHRALKFNLHLSGTLLRALPWFDAETIELIKAGLADGQFELLGSTYAQNVPYASDDWDNAQQIGLHRVVLKELFGVEPAVFWNSERCWRQSLVPLIAGGGYTTLLVEDHILHAAGLIDPVPATTTSGEHTLTLVYDDTLLRSRFNYAAWFGRPEQLLEYLRRLASRPGASQFLLAYAEDAEAMGLWSWERGYLPNAVWANLDTLLRELETTGLVELCHLSSAHAQQALSALPDSAAQWMDLALLNPEAPYHEPDYSDWFDFLHRSPKLNYFRRFYALARTRLQALGSARNDPGFPRQADTPGDRLYRQAVEVFCHHQYEFGCIGVGGRGDWGWENVRSAFLFARAAELADDPRPFQWIEDVTADGTDEQLLCDGRYLAVFTGHGGRLVAWFDLKEGRQWVGNPLAVPSATFVEHTTRVPVVKPRPNHYPGLPQDFGTELKPWKSLREKERLPTGMGRRLPRWVFEREVSTLTVYKRKTRSGRVGQRMPLRAQTGVFTDTIAVDGGKESNPDDLLDYRLEPGGVLAYLLFPAPDVLVEKRVRQIEGGLMARYDLDNRDEIAHRLRLKSSHELNPDYAGVVAGGREALEFYQSEGRYPGVRNTRTGHTLVLEPSAPWVRVEQTSNLLALEVSLTFELELAPRSQQSLEIKLLMFPF